MFFINISNLEHFLCDRRLISDSISCAFKNENHYQLCTCNRCRVKLIVFRFTFLFLYYDHFYLMRKKNKSHIEVYFKLFYSSIESSLLKDIFFFFQRNTLLQIQQKQTSLKMVAHFATVLFTGFMIYVAIPGSSKFSYILYTIQSTRFMQSLLVYQFQRFILIFPWAWELRCFYSGQYLERDNFGFRFDLLSCRL